MAADQKWGALRGDRLLNAQPTVPVVLTWLMLILVGLSLGALAYSIPHKKNLPHLIALAVVTTLFRAVLSLIHNFDRPFRGSLALESTAMQRIALEVAEDYLRDYEEEPPCDGRGNPLWPGGSASSDEFSALPTSVRVADASEQKDDQL